MPDRNGSVSDRETVQESNHGISRRGALDGVSEFETSLDDRADRSSVNSGRRRALKTIAGAVGAVPLLTRRVRGADGSFDLIEATEIGDWTTDNWEAPHIALIAEWGVSDADRNSQFQWLKDMFDSVVNEWGYLRGVQICVWQSYNDVEGASRSAREFQYDNSHLRELTSLWILAQESDVEDGASSVGSPCFTYNPSPTVDDHTDITIAWTNDWNSDKEWLGCHEIGHCCVKKEATGYNDHRLGTERLLQSTPMLGDTSKPCPSSYKPDAKTAVVSSCTAKGMEDTAEWAKYNC